jgi:hypothetical protein
MTPKELTAFRFESEQMWGLRIVKARDGVAISEQVRRAVERWLEEQQATKQEVYRVIDAFETMLTSSHNRGGAAALMKAPIPAGFGQLSGRQFGSLSDGEFTALEAFASAAGFPTKAYRDAWKKARTLWLRR